MTRCPECLNQRPDSDFRHRKTGRPLERCADCRHSAAPIEATDPPRKRVCWYCREEFVTTDFTQRICSGRCRADYDKRDDKDGELPSVSDARRAASAMKRSGIKRGKPMRVVP